MKKYFILLFFLFLFTFPVKANPWLVIEGIGIGVQVLEAGAEKLKDINKNRKTKKKLKKQKFNLKESSKIITFSNCAGLEPNYVSNAIFKIDLENRYIKIDEGGKNKLIYFRINNIENSKIISTEAFSPNKKDQKKLDQLNKYIDITHTFDAKAKTIKVIVLLEPNAPKKLKKDFTKDIQKGKLAHKTNANCYVTGSNFLIKKNEEQNSNNAQNNKAAQWVAIVKHKKKNTKYTSDDKIEINTKEKAINNATSKCWFDPKHNYPYLNCIVVSVESTNSSNASKTNKYPWNAESKHPKSTEIFRATNLSTKKKAVNLAMKKCYLFVTRTLGKVGYNDCSITNVYSKNLISVDEEAQRKEEEARRKKKAIVRTVSKANKQWIAQNKQDYIDTFNKKLNEYEIVITKLQKKRNVINTKALDFEKLYLNTTEKVENSIEDIVNISNKEIKKLLSIIKENKNLHLSNSNLAYYKDKIKNFDKVKFKDYTNYKLLKNLIMQATRSNNITDFVGKDGFEVKLPKILGGKKKKLTGDTIGFIQEFKNIKDKDLGHTFKLDQKNLDQLLKDIDNNTQSINNSILKPINDLKILDDKLSKRNFYLNFFKQNPFYKFYQLLNIFVEIIK
jgi:predicted nuclease of predicted toxin-antitoxin system